MRDYASQVETLLGRLDSYDEGLMLNQFVWGLQPDLARSVSLRYPKSISKAVLLAETTELAIKASRSPSWKGSTADNPTTAQVNLIGAEVNGVVETGEEAKEGIWDAEDLVVETLVGDHLVEIGSWAEYWKFRSFGLLQVWGAWPPGP